MPAELDEVYRQTLERIRKQAGDDGPLGMRILSWISHARRPLSVDELRHGLAVEYDGNEEKPNEFDEDNMHLSESLVDVCAGLVIIDSSSRIIRLVHYTTQEYLDKERLHIFPNAEVDISRACLMFLSYDSTRTWKNPKTWVNTSRNFSPLRGRLQARDHLVFADYATYHWFSHVKSGLQARDPDPVFLKAVADFKTIDSMASSISNLNFWATIESDRTTEALPLEVASYLGLEELVIVLLDQKTGSCTGSDRSLGLASSNGYLNVVKLLLEKGAQVDSTIEVRGHRDVRRITALGAACKAGDLSVAESLIEKGADIHGGDLAVLSPIHVAAWHNRPMLVDFLLKKGVNPNARDADGRTACHFAAMDGSLDSVKILIDAHGDLELKDNNGWTVLHHAVDTYIATKRQRNMVKFLLDRGIDASAKDKRGELASNILGNKLSRFARFHRSSYELEMGKQLRQRMLELEHKSSTRAASGVPIHR